MKAQPFLHVLIGFLGSLCCLCDNRLQALEPESYVWNNIAIGGGGFVTGVEFHPTEQGLAYARTDVGGAYRWDATRQTWVPLLDWLSHTERNLQGIESVALDPKDPNRVYLAAGTYTREEAGEAELLRSTDRGVTWKRTRLPFKLGANEAGRGSGERLVVDPNSPKLLYLGTRRAGLWRSTDHAETWSRVTSFPELPDGSAGQPLLVDGHFNYLAQPVGVVWVRIDAHSGADGHPSPVLYAAISRTGESIFRSTDAGATWHALPGQPTHLRPIGAALASDGTLFLTYADEPGPNAMHDGAVWRFTPQGEVWTEITPEAPKGGDSAESFGYAAVAVDPTSPSTLMVSTWGRSLRGEEIYRSTDRGRTWNPMLAKAEWDHSASPYTADNKIHWVSDIEIDPAKPGFAVFNTGYGLWATDDARAAARGGCVRWALHNRGLEESVPLALISPTEGAHLLSGLGDIDGFVHDDFSVSPPPSAHFPGPRFKNTEWLDYAGAAPSLIVRSGTTYRDDRILAAISDDGGRTWTSLASEPPHPGDRLRFAQGPVSISADGGTIAWTPRGGPPFLTKDRGRTWRQAPGLATQLRLVSDRVKAGAFLGYDPTEGALYSSTDDGATFVRRQEGLPHGKSMRYGFDYGELASVPGRAGECWLAAGGRLFAFTDFGAQRRDFGRLTEVSALGFGHAAPGHVHPAVFVIATIDSTHGIYRSDDAGASWQRITDGANQFGSAWRLTGDPRVFGRVYLCNGARGLVYGERQP